MTAEELLREAREALKVGEYALGNFVKRGHDDMRTEEDLQCWAESMFLPKARTALTRIDEYLEGE